jgi:hypothetical protein
MMIPGRSIEKPQLQSTRRQRGGSQRPPFFEKRRRQFTMGQQLWLEEHRRQSHMISIGDRRPDTWQRTASFEGGTHGKAGLGYVRHRSTQHTFRANATQRHEPSRETLAAFA